MGQFNCANLCKEIFPVFPTDFGRIGQISTLGGGAALVATFPGGEIPQKPQWRKLYSHDLSFIMNNSTTLDSIVTTLCRSKNS